MNSFSDKMKDGVQRLNNVLRSNLRHPVSLQFQQDDPSNTETPTVTITLTGSDAAAAVIGRSLHAVVAPSVSDNRRIAYGDVVRIIKLTDTLPNMAKAADKLAECAAAAEQPDFQDSINKMVALALLLEEATPCKVTLDLEARDGVIDPRINSIETPAQGELHESITSWADAATSMEIVEGSQWRNSRTELQEGPAVVIRALNETGRDILMEEGMKFIPEEKIKEIIPPSEIPPSGKTPPPGMDFE